MPLLYRLDASTIGTLWSDTGKTTQVSDGDSVAVWSPSAGSITTDAIQSTAGSRPTYRANYASSGKPAVQFATNFMTIAHSSGWNVTTAFDVVLVCNALSATPGAFRLLLHKFVSSGWNDGFGIGQSTTTFQAGSPAYNNCSVTEIVGETTLVYFRVGSPSRAWRVQSNPFWTPAPASTVSTTPVTNAANLTLGQQGGGGFSWRGGLHELAIFAGGETQSDIATELNAMVSKWDIPTGFDAETGTSGFTGLSGVGRLGT